MWDSEATRSPVGAKRIRNTRMETNSIYWKSVFHEAMSTEQWASRAAILSVIITKPFVTISAHIFKTDGGWSSLTEMIAIQFIIRYTRNQSISLSLIKSMPFRVRKNIFELFIWGFGPVDGLEFEKREYDENVSIVWCVVMACLWHRGFDTIN